MRHQTGLFRALKIALYGVDAALQHGEAALAPARLVKERGHVFPDGQLGIERNLGRSLGRFKGDAGAFFIGGETVEVRLKKAGCFLPVHHSPQTILFRFQLEEELAQTVGFRQMRFGRLRPGKGRDAP